jgi:hypothetical protein
MRASLLDALRANPAAHDEAVMGTWRERQPRPGDASEIAPPAAIDEAEQAAQAAPQPGEGPRSRLPADTALQGLEPWARELNSRW